MKNEEIEMLIKANVINNVHKNNNSHLRDNFTMNAFRNF